MDIQNLSCGKGIGWRGPMNYNVTFRARSTLAKTKVFNGQRSHDWGPLPGTVMGESLQL